MMKRILLAALAVTVTGMFGAAPADAQDYPDWRVDFGVNGGMGAYSAMLDEEDIAGGDESVRFGPGWNTGAQLTAWLTPRIGLRANGMYTERPLIEGSMFDSGDDYLLVEDFNVWNVTGDLLFRLTGSEARARPYLALGLGAAYIDHGGEVLLAGTEDGDDELRGLPFTTQGSSFAVAEEWQLAGLVGLGTDLRLARNVGLRLEVGDRIWDAPMRTFPVGGDPDEDIGKVVHNPYVQLGLHYLMGVRTPEVIVAPPPPPPPAPAPAPAPPAEERIRVCVVDPSAPTGLTMVDAIYLPETRDTVVVRDGTRRDFATVVPSVTVASDADWFVRGEPVVVNLDRGATIEYTTWQSARMIESNQLVMIGTTRGLPVYASVDDVRDIRTDWDAARRAAASDDLSDIVAQDAALAAELEDIEFLYVPLRSTGCVFQTVRVVEQVQKK